MPTTIDRALRKNVLHAMEEVTTKPADIAIKLANDTRTKAFVTWLTQHEPEPVKCAYDKGLEEHHASKKRSLDQQQAKKAQQDPAGEVRSAKRQKLTTYFNKKKATVTAGDGAALQTVGRVASTILHAPIQIKAKGYNDHLHNEDAEIAITNPSAENTKRELAKVYRTQLGITMGMAKIVQPLKEQFLALHNERGNEKKVQDIFDTCRLFKFGPLKNEIMNHLTTRLQQPASRTKIHSSFDKSNPIEIIRALKTIKSDMEDLMIHRAFCQIKFYMLVEEKVQEQNIKLHRRNPASHVAYIKCLVTEVGSDQTRSDFGEIERRNISDYYCGRKWLEVAEMFGGTAVVILMVVAGVSTHSVSSAWTSLQRQCLLDTSKYLVSVRKFVIALGEDGLDLYCRDGYLSQEIISRIAMVQEEIEKDVDRSRRFVTVEDGEDESDDDNTNNEDDSEDDQTVQKAGGRKLLMG